LADGTYGVTVSATDAAGNTGTQNFTGALVIDTAAPAVSAASLVTNDNTPLLAGTFADAPQTSGLQSVMVTAAGQTVAATLNADGTWQVELPGVIVDGNHVVTATVTDNAGNVATDTATLTVDTKAPVVTVSSLTTTSKTPTLAGTVSDVSPSSGITGVTVVVGGQTLTAAVSNGTWTTVVGAPLAAGTYNVVATASDAAGNTAADGTTNELVIQTETPVVTMNALVTNNRRPTLSGAVTGGNVASLTLKVNGTSFTARVTGATWTAAVPKNLRDGRYDVLFTLRDTAGVVTNGVFTRALTIDTVKPSGKANVVVTNAVYPVLTGTAADALSGVRSVVVAVAGQTVTATVNPNGTWSAPLPKSVAPGVYNVVTTVVDFAGNSTKTTTAKALTVDRTAPAVAVTSQTTRDNTPLLSGTFGDANPSGGIASGSVVVSGVAYPAVLKGNKWTAQVAALLPDGRFDVQVLIVDKAGNTGTDRTTGELVVDTTGPAATVKKLVTAVNKPTITGTVNDPAGVASVVVSVAGRNINAGVANNGTWTAKVPVALANGVYEVRVTTRDKLGNSLVQVFPGVLVIDTLRPAVALASASLTANQSRFGGTWSDGAPSSGIDAVFVCTAGTCGRGTLNGANWNAALDKVLGNGVHIAATAIVDRARNIGLRFDVLTVSASGIHVQPLWPALQRAAAKLADHVFSNIGNWLDELYA